MRRFCICLLLLCAGTAGAAETISNPAEPRDGLVTYRLEEAWRAGGEDGDVFFGLVPRVATGPDGNVYILDSQTSRVLVYSREGEPLRELFREGDGPGEVRAPRDLTVFPDGRVGVAQEFPGRVTFVEADGTPAGKVMIGGADGGAHALISCENAGGELYVSGTHQGRGDTPGVSPRENFLERIDAEGATQAQFAVNHTTYDFNDFHFTEREHMPPFWWCFAGAGDGTVYTVRDRDAYAVDVFAPDGTLLRTVTREYEPLLRTDIEYRRVEGMISSAMSSMPFDVTIVVEKEEAAISGLHRGLQLHPDGSLWVLSGRGVRSRLTGAMVVYDVFDPEGVFVKQVALEAPHDGQRVGVYLSGADHVLVLKGYFESLAAQFGTGATFGLDDEEPDVPEVICYRIVR